MAGWSLVLHGGAGVIARDVLTPVQEAAYRGALARIATLGADLLGNGASALDTVEAVVRALEDDPLFNAGRGAVFTAEGENRLDASIMDGATCAAGAVAGVGGIANPVSLARAVMERSPHVMLAGPGAEAFARSIGMPHMPPAYFFSPVRWRSLVAFLTQRGLPLPPLPDGVLQADDDVPVHDEGKKGTVGCVACDAQGHVAAATSTGGTTGKRWGRVGDTPIIGAGCYAANESCAVSCTGAGEYFIRLAVAHAIAARVALKGEALQAAADHVVKTELTARGGGGGVIAVTPAGDCAVSFNTPGMYRAMARAGEGVRVALYGEE